MCLSTRLPFVIAALLLLALSAAAVPAQGARCRPCEVAQERCSVSCFGRENDLGACLLGCDNAAALCSCDEPATLSAEDYVERFGLDGATHFKAAACHSTAACGPAYGACTNWSTTYTECGDPTCGPTFNCPDCDEWGHCSPGPGMRQLKERYRICLSELNEPCTQYQRSSNHLYCGC